MNQRLELQTLVHEIGPGFAKMAGERDIKADFVGENLTVLREHKVYSAMVPEDLGGGGIGYGEMCQFVRALAGYCGSTALTLSMHQHLLSAPIYNHMRGNPGQALLEKVAGGELVLVSTGANDWMDSTGEVELTDGGFLVSARKAFSSASPMGNVAVSTAPYNDPEAGWQVLHFPVPLSAEGVSIADDWDTMGMRSSGSNTIIMERVFVPEEAVALRRPRGVYHPAYNVVLGVAMPLVMSAYLGVAEAAFALAKGQAGKKAADPVVHIGLGQLINHLTTAQLAVDSMVGLVDEWQFQATNDFVSEILARKTIAAKAVLAVGEAALETFGGAGFHRKFGLERMLRDLHAGQFHPLPERRQHLFSGRIALGLEPIEIKAKVALDQAAE